MTLTSPISLNIRHNWIKPLLLSEGTRIEIDIDLDTYTGLVKCVCPHTGQTIWEARVPDRIEGTPAASSHCVYIGCFDKKLYAFCIVTGEQKWFYETGGIVKSTPLVLRDGLVFGSYDHHVYSLDFKGQVKWKCEVR